MTNQDVESGLRLILGAATPDSWELMRRKRVRIIVAAVGLAAYLAGALTMLLA